MSDPEIPYEVLVERIKATAEAITAFAGAYMDVPREDTSPEERQKLADVNALLDQALDRFQ